MKNSSVFGAGFLAGLGVWALTGFATVAAQEPEVQGEEIRSLRSEVEATKKTLDEHQKAIDGLTKYVEQQAKAAAALEGTLSASEAAGFTAGINPRSRQLLLEGWRARLKAAQEVPKAKKEEPEEPGPKRGRRLFK